MTGRMPRGGAENACRSAVRGAVSGAGVDGQARSVMLHCYIGVVAC